MVHKQNNVYVFSDVLVFYIDSNFFIPVMNATRTDELSSQCRSLGEKISKKLGGKPVYLSCSLPEEVTMAMEKDLFRTIKLHPERF